MKLHTSLLHFLIGMVLVLGLTATPAGAARSTQAAIVPFSGTATLTVTSSGSLVPARATADLLKREQTETFSVRDARHWRVNVHVAAPLIDSHDQTIVENGNQVVTYDTLFNQAFRMPDKIVSGQSVLLSNLLLTPGVPLGTTAAQFMSLVKRDTRLTVQSLGQRTVAGRKTDGLRISPLGWTTTGPCTGPKNCAKHQKGFGWITLWIDHQYGVVLRYEEHGVPKQSGGPQGMLYLVTSIAFGSGPSDADLSYTPPAPITDVPQNGVSTGTSSSGGGPGVSFQAPPGFIAVGSPVVNGSTMSLRGSGSGSEWLSGGPSVVQGLFRGTANQGFVYVEERTRALGLPPGLMTGNPLAAASCQAWTGTFSDGLRWLAMMRGPIAVLVVANKLTQADLVQYAASSICTAPIVPALTAQEVQDQALDRLEVEIDITRQILSWVVAAAPSPADKSILKGFDARLASFDRTVFAIRHRGDPQAVYHPPGFPPAAKHTFKNAVQALQGEMGAVKDMLLQAEAAVQSPTDRQALEQGGTLLDDLIKAATSMLHG